MSAAIFPRSGCCRSAGKKKAKRSPKAAALHNDVIVSETDVKVRQEDENTQGQGGDDQHDDHPPRVHLFKRISQ